MRRACRSGQGSRIVLVADGLKFGGARKWGWGWTTIAMGCELDGGAKATGALQRMASPRGLHFWAFGTDESGAVFLSHRADRRRSLVQTVKLQTDEASN